MFLPYIDYDIPISLCILGLDKTPSEKLIGTDLEYVSLGQRALAKFPFYVVYDRATGSATFEMGNVTQTDDENQMGIQIAISCSIVIILFAMLVYLIFLRRNRIKAEEWLEQHKGTLFSQSANLKTEEEILDALVKSKELKEMLEKNQASGDASNSPGNFPAPASPLTAGDKNTSSAQSNRRSSSSANDPSKLLPKKNFSNDPSA